MNTPTYTSNKIKKIANKLAKKYGKEVADISNKMQKMDAMRMGIPFDVFQDALSVALSIISSKQYESADLNEKEYKIQYVLKNPPPYAKKNPDVWAQAFLEYLRRNGVKNPEKKKKVDNVEWNEVVRIYNTMIGKKNRQRPKDFVKKKNKDLKVASKTLLLKRSFHEEINIIIDKMLKSISE